MKSGGYFQCGSQYILKISTGFIYEIKKEDSPAFMCFDHDNCWCCHKQWISLWRPPDNTGWGANWNHPVIANWTTCSVLNWAACCPVICRVNSVQFYGRLILHPTGQFVWDRRKSSHKKYNRLRWVPFNPTWSLVNSSKLVQSSVTCVKIYMFKSPPTSASYTELTQRESPYLEATKT